MTVLEPPAPPDAPAPAGTATGKPRRRRLAEPVVTENSADAGVRALLCGNPSDVPANTTIGSARERAEQVCSTTAPARDARLGQVSPEAPYLVVEVTPRALGTVTVQGLRVRYRTGVQRGEQDAGLVVTVPTSAAR